ncbi:MULTISPECIES: ribosomal protein S18-alanine N-acetyltransferase [Clostridium]|uniref:ribosomal protein S18-alanine N-acetyltransferase n=1 Tax=Clostridium TaxID=1485 RepID=UPI002152E27E|nr:ribosomal protein S18-alanine N-acetyltransferase [Clostridium sp. LY3-2]MCR6514384.1 ribosomal protein S18-alanine N-acetyltransferase [Clostridium sp. LY3-2]
MKLILKEMDESHILEVKAISDSSLKESWSLDSIKNELSNSLATYIVGILDNKVIGFAGAWLIASEGQITNVSVSKDFRGQGIGFKIINELLKTLSSKGSKEVTLEVRESNLAAQKLYEKCGFKNEGIRKNFYPDKENAIIMWKRD